METVATVCAEIRLIYWLGTWDGYYNNIYSLSTSMLSQQWRGASGGREAGCYCGNIQHYICTILLLSSLLHCPLRLP